MPSITRSYSLKQSGTVSSPATTRSRPCASKKSCTLSSSTSSSSAGLSSNQSAPAQNKRKRADQEPTVPKRQKIPPGTHLVDEQEELVEQERAEEGLKFRRECKIIFDKYGEPSVSRSLPSLMRCMLICISEASLQMRRDQGLQREPKRVASSRLHPPSLDEAGLGRRSSRKVG